MNYQKQNQHYKQNLKINQIIAQAQIQAARFRHLQKMLILSEMEVLSSRQQLWKIMSFSKLYNKWKDHRGRPASLNVIAE